MSKILKVVVVLVMLAFFIVAALSAQATVDSSSGESSATKSIDSTESTKVQDELLKKKAELAAEAAKKQAELKLQSAKRAAAIEKKRISTNSEVVKKSIEIESEEANRSAELDKKRIEIESEYQKKKAELELKKVEKAADAALRCELIESRVLTITTRHENNKSRNVTAYENMYARLSKVIKRFEDKGLDVATLSADLAVLNNKIIKLQSDHATYLTNLLDSKQYACGKSEGEFKANLGTARDKMAIVKADIADIKNYYNTTIKTDINALKSLVESSEKSTSTTSSPASAEALTVPATTP